MLCKNVECATEETEAGLRGKKGQERGRREESLTFCGAVRNSSLTREQRPEENKGVSPWVFGRRAFP